MNLASTLGSTEASPTNNSFWSNVPPAFNVVVPESISTVPPAPVILLNELSPVNVTLPLFNTSVVLPVIVTPFNVTLPPEVVLTIAVSKP